MQLDIFFTYYLKTHRIFLAQNGRNKKHTPVPMDPMMMMMGNGRFFPIFFGTNGPSNICHHGNGSNGNGTSSRLIIYKEMTARWCFNPPFETKRYVCRCGGLSLRSPLPQDLWLRRRICWSYMITGFNRILPRMWCKSKLARCSP